MQPAKHTQTYTGPKNDYFSRGYIQNIFKDHFSLDTALKETKSTLVFIHFFFLFILQNPESFVSLNFYLTQSLPRSLE